MLLLKDEDVQRVLTMSKTLEVLEETQREIVKGDAATMGRIDIYSPHSTPDSYYRWAVMTGGTRSDGFVVARMLSDIVSWPGEKGQQRENKHCLQPGTYCGLLFLFSVKDADKGRTVELAGKLHRLGFRIVATQGTWTEITQQGIPAESVLKITEGRPHIVDAIINGDFDLIVNTTVGKQSIQDSFSIRRNALEKQIPYVTTIRAAAAVVQAIESLRSKAIDVKAIQLYNK